MPEKENSIPAPPKGLKRIKWLGPGFLWMVSAAGSGELLFTPRVGSLYGYALIWALFAAVILKWFINREVGRFAVCTGHSIIDGFASLPGPKNWALWFILVPQILVAVISIAGLAGGAATALILVLPGGVLTWMIVSVLMASALVFWGKYKGVEKASVILASTLSVASIFAAVSLSPSVSEMAQGLKPDLTMEMDISEILPWLGFMLSGAAGLMWYSYWIKAKGYGRSAITSKSKEEEFIPKSMKELSATDKKNLSGWTKQMTLDTSLAVAGTLIITLSFLVLGTEVLRPQQLVPEENKIASTLGQLLSSLWGPIGFWFMVVGVFIGFWDTVLSDQDGHSRLFANGTRHLFQNKLKKLRLDEIKLKKYFIIILVTILPVLLYIISGNPVELLKLSGAIEAAHIPVVTALVLYLNKKHLPVELQPSRVSFGGTLLAGIFFAFFAITYLVQVFT